MKYKKCLKRVLFNAVVVGSLFQLVTYPLWKWRGVRFALDLPTFPQTIVHLLFYIFAYEFFFYYTHRLLIICCIYSNMYNSKPQVN